MRDVMVVSGAIANKCRNGGEAWVRLSWAMGLRKLGFDVYIVEQIAPGNCTDEALSYFRSVTETFGFADRSALMLTNGEVVGGTARCLHAADAATLLVNISGHLTVESLLRRFKRTAYVDIDPGFTQFWHADANTPFRIAKHDAYFTIGENIGSPDCPIPTGDIQWRHVRQPVVLEDWPMTPTNRPQRFTTIASWRGAFGPVQYDRKNFGLKVHEFRKVFSLPRLCPDIEFELALDIHPDDAKDKAALEVNGWRLADPNATAGDPLAFRQYVQDSGAEFSVAQGIYIDTRCGWFSDRTVRYLASGKPALVQETGFSRHLKTGEGLLSFENLEQAAAGCARMMSDYHAHAQAARAVAETYFDSNKVLSQFVEQAAEN